MIAVKTFRYFCMVMPKRFNHRYFHTTLKMVFIFIAVVGLIGESAFYFSDLNENKFFSSCLIDNEDNYSEEQEDNLNHHLFFGEYLKQGQFTFRACYHVSLFENEIITSSLPYGRQLCIAYKCLKWFLLF